VQFPLTTCAQYTFYAPMWVTPDFHGGVTGDRPSQKGSKAEAEDTYNEEQQEDKTLDQDVPMSEASAIAV